MKKVFLFIAVLALILTACSGGQTQPAQTTKPTAGPTNEQGGGQGGETVQIRLWGHQAPAFNKAIQKLIDDFMAENPGVTVKYETFPWDVFIQTIQTSLPAGNVADVVLLPGGHTCRYASGGQLLEVPADVLTLEQAQDLFYAAPLGGQTCNGKLYGIPAEYNLEYGGAYVNETFFREVGLPYPPQWKTWDEMLADAEKLTKYGQENVMEIAGLHFTNNDQLFTYFLAGILEQGGNYFAEDGKHFVFNSPEAVATIQKMIDMVEKNKVVDPIIFNAESEWVGASFAQGHTAIAILGSWFAGDAKISYPDLKFDYVQLPPMMGNTHRFTSVGGWGYVVSNAAANPQLAWKLATYLGAKKESALHFNSVSATIPAMKAVAEDASYLEAAPFAAAVVPILGKGQYQGDLTDASQLEFEIVYPIILDALQGNLSAQEAAQKIHEAANAMVDAAQ
ncbi:MAG: ABC transporter substrate-binding protein [Candidatus Villigracilaceae bacterium]